MILWLFHLLFGQPPSTLLFQSWAQLYHQHYPNSAQRHFRYTIFQQNLQHIYSRNSQNTSYRLGINAYSDLTFQEFRQYHAGVDLVPQITTHCMGELPAKDGSDVVDWSNKYVVSVENQGQCGSSWAFSALGAAQGFIAKSRSLLVDLSAQQLVDCSQKYGNYGCQGGLLDAALLYGIDTGFTTTKDYPYTGEKQTCKYNADMKTYKIHECAPVLKGINKQFIQAVSYLPVAGAIDSDFPDFQHYSSGVYEGDCGNSVDFGVLIVGYDKSSSKKFWKVKASLGQSWGEKGYMRLQMKEENGEGKCGIQGGGFIVTN